MQLLPAVVLASLTLQADTTVHRGMDPTPHSHLASAATAQDAAQPQLASRDTIHHRMEGHSMAGHQMAGHQMFSLGLGGGWRLAGMGQVFPIGTQGFADPSSPLDDRGFYLTQPAAMLNLESPARRLVLRFTPNLEALTLEDGESTFGGWGEGFLDARHPHTLLHELMLSVNFWDTPVGSLALSGGKGFAPFGTDDPMSRPSVKYPTNHHLSQILERFTLNAAWLGGPWSLEVGVFGGAEPEGPYDLSNIESFGDSWSARVIRRFGPSFMGQSRWEVGASVARVNKGHGEGEHGADHSEDPGGPADHADGHSGATGLFNTTVRFDSPLSGDQRLYAMAEFSVSDPAEGQGFWSFLAEASWRLGRHTPYARFERATRPEYVRDGVSGDPFFRYDHDADPVGATAWSILSLGYGYTATRGDVSIRPFVEAQLFTAAGERGGVSAAEILGDTRFAALSFGARVFLGGDPMRMGSYGLLDPITRMGR